VLKPRGVFLTTASEPFASLLRVSNLDWYKYDWVWDKVNVTGFLNAKSYPMKQHENILVFSLETGFSYFPQMMKRNKRRIDTRTGKIYGKNEESAYGIRHTINGQYDYLYPKTIISISNANQSNKVHSTQKPSALYEYLIKTYTQPGDLVLDPFCGSGTTGLACMKTGRQYILGDSSQEYADLARLRLQNADPYQPSDQGDGVTQLSLFGDNR
jgi:site-specific DNA-methyltransferase (adenine-specific)